MYFIYNLAGLKNGCTDPQTAFGFHGEVEHGGIVGGGGDELEHSNLRNENLT